jgi:DNA repair photolyase
MAADVDSRPSRRELPQLSAAQLATVSPSLRDIVSYRKSGLSLNHVIGCPLDCAYCVRHFQQNFDMKLPHLICPDEVAIATLLGHPYFQPHVTPLQLFNRATDPFVPGVRRHTYHVLEELDSRGLTNHVLLITRASLTSDDMTSLETLRSLRVTLLFTYSGIEDRRIEPIAPSQITVKSIRLACRIRSRTKVVVYWRPIVPGWNDDDASMRRVLDVARVADAIVFTGYYHRPENAEHIARLGIPVPYADPARRKIMPSDLEARVIRAHRDSGIAVPLMRKTSCGVAFAHAESDYNGHWGVPEVCDICPAVQRERCRSAHRAPAETEMHEVLQRFAYDSDFLVEDGHVWTAGLGEERRYHLQHTLGYQVWDVDWPHFPGRHGRAELGWQRTDAESGWHASTREAFHRRQIEEDD